MGSADAEEGGAPTTGHERTFTTRGRRRFNERGKQKSNANSYSPDPEPATRIMYVMVIEPYCSSPVPTGSIGAFHQRRDPSYVASARNARGKIKMIIWRQG
jgi:hypothetical protein